MFDRIEYEKILQNLKDKHEQEILQMQQNQELEKQKNILKQNQITNYYNNLQKDIYNKKKNTEKNKIIIIRIKKKR